MDRSPFLRGFVPGIVIGIFSSILFLNTLWRSPAVLTRELADGSVSGNQRMTLSRLLAGSDKHLDSENVPESFYPQKLLRGARKERQVGEDQDCSLSMQIEAQQLVSNTTVLLLVLIQSSPRATELRNSIRATWLRNHTQQGRYAAKFVIGAKNLQPKDERQLACESEQYGDLLLLPDTYDPIKAQDWSSSTKVLQSFSWAVSHLKFSYLLKCTDSTFAVLDTILDELEQSHREDYLLWGFFAGSIQAVKEGRLGEKNWFLCSHYLPFPQGGGYIISWNLVSLIQSLETDLQHYTHDDIALGVWLSPFSGIHKKHDVRFNTGYYSRGCRNVYIITHKETSSSMLLKYDTWKESGALCKEEFLSRLSYVYDWTAPANRCCIRKSGIP